MKTWKADLALAGVTVIWGATFVMVKSALDHVSPVLFLALRFTLAAAVLFALYRSSVRRIAGRSAILPGLIAGVCLFLGYFFQTTGLRFTTPSKSAFLTGLAIPMVPLASAIVYRKAPRRIEVAGVTAASVGMALMTLEGGILQLNQGDALTFLCAIAFSLHIVAVGHFSGRMPYETLAVLQIGTAAILAIGSFWWVEIPHIRWTREVLAAVLVTGLLATALAFSVQAWAQQFTTPTRTALIFALEPVCAWFTSWWITGEILSRRGAFGAMCILFGIALVEMKRFNALEHQSSSAANADV